MVFLNAGEGVGVAVAGSGQHFPRSCCESHLGLLSRLGGGGQGRAPGEVQEALPATAPQAPGQTLKLACHALLCALIMALLPQADTMKWILLLSLFKVEILRLRGKGLAQEHTAGKRQAEI